MLCQFLLYIKVNHLYVYIYPLFFRFPSHLGHHRALSRVPCAIQQVLISYLFYTQQCIYVNPNLPIHPTPPPPLGIHKFVLYICVSISALQISSSLFECYSLPDIVLFTGDIVTNEKQVLLPQRLYFSCMPNLILHLKHGLTYWIQFFFFNKFYLFIFGCVGSLLLHVGFLQLQ